jgi:hypothetical protein
MKRSLELLLLILPLKCPSLIRTGLLFLLFIINEVGGTEYQAAAQSSIPGAPEIASTVEKFLPPQRPASNFLTTALW